ncbi:RNA 2',3'-cyclic phosphodiesterase [Dactylosporangium fulvum]|uniref:RNA 2',3'-cyclic phosphodiesterase n=1 Tax=Dactylosporangium fulvum TaxID=53359 RepID=A0ABY5VX62_9ACTN|nr:2'-5' RNA ligase family protein [Dactylosporangium fulvum]UWP82278.1 2'-5' RNA ligase family protein [Dactylosporangium fulvum]
MRLFIAAYPPADVREHFGDLVARLAVARPMPPGRSTRLATPDRWHLTLAFLGDLTEGQADGAADALRDLRVSPPTVRITGGSRFGRGRFTIMVADVKKAATGRRDEDTAAERRDEGVAAESRELAGLADAVRKALRRRRVPFDHKPFRPHITIARPGDRLPAAELAADLSVLDAYEGPLWTVDEVRLVRSFMGPRPEYEPITTVALTP